jgi:hypothetical protein
VILVTGRPESPFLDSRPPLHKARGHRKSHIKKECHMAITAQERADILELVVLMFDAAPGATYLADIVAAYEATGRDLQQLARLLAHTTAFQALHPNFQVAGEFASDLLSTLGLEGDAEARDWVIAQFNAGMGKGEIMFAAWKVLENLPPTAAPQYLAARDLLENKAQVSAYYSVTLQGRATDVAQLQSVLGGVTADDASIADAIRRLDADRAVGPQLTTGQDNIVIGGRQPTVVTGVVDGDADGNTAGSTYTAADRITGNGSTSLQLFVIEGGNAPFAQLTNVSQVNLFAATQTDLQFNAAGWKGVGAVNLSDGLNGLDVFVDHLQPGTSIGVSRVTGSIAAEYQRGGAGNVFASVRNNDSGGAGGTLRLDAQGHVVVGLGDSASASLTATGELTLGNVTVEGGEDAWFGLMLDTDDDVAIGHVDVSLGEGSSALVRVDGIEGDLTLGDVAIAAPSGAQVIVGGVTGDAAIGDVLLVAGADAAATLSIDGIGGDLAVGNVELAGSDEARLEVAVSGVTDAAFGNIVMTAGDESSVTAVLESGGGLLSLGDADLSAGDESTVSLSLDAAGSLLAGSLSAAAGTSSNATVMLGSMDAMKQPGASITAGDVSASVGDDGSATVAIAHIAASVTVTDDTPAFGDLSVGDITVAAGNVSSVEDAVSATAFVLYGGKGADHALGHLTVGDVDVSVGNGSVSGTLESLAQANVGVGAIVQGAMGDVTIGDIRLAGGDFAALNALAGAAAFGGGSLGDGAIGDVSFDAGESAVVNLGVYWAAGAGAAEVGSLAIGTVGVHAAEDAQVAIDVRHGGFDATLNALGDLSAEGVQAVLGDNSQVRVGVHSGGEFEGLVTDTVGDFTIGDIAIAVSATTDVGLSGGSRIEVELSKVDRNIATGGAFTVGDVHLATGNSGEIGLDILYSGTFESMGDVSIGTLDLRAGNASSVAAGIAIVNQLEDGAYGDIALGGIELQLGEGSEAAIELALGAEAAALGEFSVGDVNVALGKNAAASVALLDAAIGGDVAGIEVGNIQAQLAAGASFAFDLSVEAAGEIGEVSVGNIALDLGAGATVERVGLTLQAAAIEAIRVGDVTATVTDGASANIVLQADAGDGAGAMTVGDITLSVADAGAQTDEDGAPIGGSLTLDILNLGDAGADVTLGDLRVDVAGSADDDEVAISVTAGGDLVIGDITVTGAGAFVLDGAAHAGEANTSYLALDVAGTVKLGNVDFSAYAGDAIIDLRFSDSGAASIRGGAGDDQIWGNAGANVIVGGAGVDRIDISQGGNDTIVTSKGESGKAAGTLDVVTGFTAGDKLDFNLAAGAANNYVERDDDFTSFAQFLQNAAGALNSTVKYFVQDDGVDTYVAVNYGSGEADMVIVLAGVADATTLKFEDFVA